MKRVHLNHPISHSCPWPDPGDPPLFCGHCRAWRKCEPGGAVISAPAAGWDQWAGGPGHLEAQDRRGRRHCACCGADWPCPGAWAWADREARLHILELQRSVEAAGQERELSGGQPAPAPAVPADPERGSPAWWAGATRDDLEPGWWGQPDVPVPAVPDGACRECRVTWPPPDASGVCRYCRLAAAERAAAAQAEAVEATAVALAGMGPRPAPRPARWLAAYALTLLRLIGALTVLVWGVELGAWALRAILG